MAFRRLKRFGARARKAIMGAATAAGGVVMVGGSTTEAVIAAVLGAMGVWGAPNSPLPPLHMER